MAKVIIFNLYFLILMIAICQKLYHYASNVLDSKFEWRPENETHKKICQSISLSPFGLQEQKYHRLGGLTNISFSQYWRLRSLRSRHQQIQRLVRTCFLVYKWLSSWITTWQKVERSKLSWDSYKGLNPIYENSALMISSNLNFLLKTSALNVITLGARVSAYEFAGWGDINIWSITFCPCPHPPNSQFFSHAKYIHCIPQFPKLSTCFSINSKV